jgi:hypothetical protein
VPVAVPAGRYNLLVSVALKPVFARIDKLTTIDLVVPSENVLEVRLAELESEDMMTRQEALMDLRFFPDDGEQVFPRLLACLEDEAGNIRTMALSVMQDYPLQVAEHVDTFIEMLLGDESVSNSEKVRAAYLLGKCGPLSEKVRAALEKAFADADGKLKVRLKYGVDAYRKRAPPPEPSDDDSDPRNTGIPSQVQTAGVRRNEPGSVSTSRTGR